MKANWVTYATFFISLSYGFIVGAEEPLQPVTSGMSYYEVLKSRGAPIEKDSNETKRVARWRYRDGIVTFVNGRVVTNDDRHRHLPIQAQGSMPVAGDTKKNAASKSSMSQADVDDIINSIPNESGESKSPSPASLPPVGSLPEPPEPFTEE